MPFPDLPFWDKNETNNVTPPVAKQNSGAKAGKREAARFINNRLVLIWKWLRGLSGSYADIIVGTTAQVTSKDATHDMSDWAAAVVAGDHVHFKRGLTHTLEQNEDISVADVKITAGPDAILAFSTFTLTLSGARSKIVGGVQISGAGAGDLIGSADGILLEITGADYTVFALSNGARGKVFGAQTIEVLSGSGTWTKPGDIEAIHITLCAGGGGGGASQASNGRGGGGGGGGGYVSFSLLVSANKSYNVGTGGAGATATGADGADGADTTFGTGVDLLTIVKGLKGIGGATAAPDGGDGGGLNLVDATGATGSSGGILNGGGGGGTAGGEAGGNGASSTMAIGGVGGTAQAVPNAGGGGGASFAPGGDGGNAEDFLTGTNGGVGKLGSGGGGASSGDTGSGDADGGDGGDGIIILIY